MSVNIFIEKMQSKCQNVSYIVVFIIWIPQLKIPVEKKNPVRYSEVALMKLITTIFPLL